ncbi:unknown [Tannerella sp. CAG:118]|nr:unknown [Tannerella sp. CAG:118]
MAIPPKLIVFIVKPIKCKVSIDTNNDRGRATNEIIVVLRFIRNRNNTIITKNAPSNNDFCILSIELSMKRDCLNTSFEICTSGGIDFCKSIIDASNALVKSNVLVFGCLVTVTKTAGFPFSEANPNLGALFPICIVAISSNRIGTLFSIFTIDLESSSVLLVDSIPRTIYSFPNSYKIPPLAF